MLRTEPQGGPLCNTSGSRGIRSHDSPTELGLLILALLLGADQDVKRGPSGGVAEVEPATGQQFAHFLHQLQVRSLAQGGKGRLCDAKHLHVPYLQEKMVVVLYTCPKYDIQVRTSQGLLYYGAPVNGTASNCQVGLLTGV